MIDIVVAGHLCLDMFPAFAPGAALAPGETTEVGAATVATGGAVSNVGLALHKLGVAVRLAGRVGDDMFGQAVRAVLEAAAPGLGAQVIAAPGESTSYTMIISPSDDTRHFVHHTGCNATFTAHHLEDTILADARLLHIGYPPLMAALAANDGDELLALLQRAKRMGLTTSLDMAMIDLCGPMGRIDWQRLLARCLPYVDLFVPSAPEILQMLDRPRFKRLAATCCGDALLDCLTAAEIVDLADALMALGAPIVLLKLGHRGVLLRTAGAARIAGIGRAAPLVPQQWADCTCWAACYDVPVIGTTGAGDTTIAGLLMALVRGMAAEAALDAACAVGACSVIATDALSGVRDWPATQAFVAGRARCATGLGAGWHELRPGVWRPV